MEEGLLLNSLSAANPKSRCSAFGALPALWLPGDWGGKSPGKEEPTEFLFLKADIQQQGQVFLSTALRKFHFLAADLLQDVFLLPGESFAGSRGLEEGELWQPHKDWTQPQQEKFSLLELFGFDCSKNLQLVQTGFSSWLRVAAVGSQLWPHGSKVGESSSQSADTAVRDWPGAAFQEPPGLFQLRMFCESKILS